MRYYEKDGKRWYGGKITLDGRTIINPTEEQLLAAGYEAKEPQPHVPTLEEVKARKIAEIDAYDTSTAVNGFTLNGETVWLEYEMRLRARTKIEAAEKAGEPTVILWFGTVCYELPRELASQLIWIVEGYAGKCYDVTAAHKAAVEALDSIAAVNAYEYKTGYPEKPNISTQPQEEAQE